MLRVDKFNNIAKTPLDEWISFLKNGEIPETVTAPGLMEAREKLKIANLSDAERRAYKYAMENISYQRSVIETGRIEGKQEKAEEDARNLLKLNILTIEQIAEAIGLSVDAVKQIAEKLNANG